MLSSQSKLQVICSKSVCFDMQQCNGIPTVVCGVMSANMRVTLKLNKFWVPEGTPGGSVENVG